MEIYRPKEMVNSQPRVAREGRERKRKRKRKKKDGKMNSEDQAEHFFSCAEIAGSQIREAASPEAAKALFISRDFQFPKGLRRLSYWKGFVLSGLIKVRICQETWGVPSPEARQGQRQQFCALLSISYIHLGYFGG